MDIFLNDEKLNYSLESEDNLGQVIGGVETWLTKVKMVITSINSDNLVLSYDSEENWGSTPVAGIGTLRLTATKIDDLRLDNMETVLDFLSLLRRGIETDNEDGLNELLAGFQYMLASLEKLFKPVSLLDIDRPMQELESLLAGSTAESILAWPDGVRQKALGSIQTISTEVEARIEEVRAPLDVLSRITGELTASAAQIGEVSVKLQMGRDREAMKDIVRFSDLSGKLLRLLSRMEETLGFALDGLQIGDKSVGEFFGGFNTILRQLTETFDINDVVLMGDLLEYEVAPRIELLVKFIEAIEQKDTITL